MAKDAKEIEPENNEPEVTYQSVCKLQEKKIGILIHKILKDFEEYELHPWAMLETLDVLRIWVEDSLGTVIDPGTTDVEEEDKRLEVLYDEIYKNKRIAERVLALINSPGYRLKECSISQIWNLAESTDPYW